MSSQSLFPSYSLRERQLDQVVHALALAATLVAIPLLFGVAEPWNDATRLVACLLYSFGLLWMWSFSAAYNSALEERRREILRRFDHAGIFLMIAGSYSPFALVKIGGGWGLGVFLFIWALAGLGLFLALRYPRSSDRASMLLCLIMGWSILLLIKTLIEAVSTAVFVLLVVGGLLFTGGIGFHLAKSLRYHNAIWHAFVLSAAVCHYLAIFLALRV
ncbi:MAG: hemolysin III family protein [Rhodospirillales bacterium]